MGIKTRAGLRWLTIAVESKGAFHQSIDATRVADLTWATRHIQQIEASYRSAAEFENTAPWLFESLRKAARFRFLSEINRELLTAICGRLEIRTPIVFDRELVSRSKLDELSATERLSTLAEAAGATHYLTGPAARSYLELGPFTTRGIEVRWMSYDGYPDYAQCWGQFAPQVSIVDLLLNCGDDAIGKIRAPDT
jgi:hypothetical protein